MGVYNDVTKDAKEAFIKKEEERKKAEAERRKREREEKWSDFIDAINIPKKVKKAVEASKQKAEEEKIEQQKVVAELENDEFLFSQVAEFVKDKEGFKDLEVKSKDGKTVRATVITRSGKEPIVVFEEKVEFEKGRWGESDYNQNYTIFTFNECGDLEKIKYVIENRFTPQDYGTWYQETIRNKKTVFNGKTFVEDKTYNSRIESEVIGYIDLRDQLVNKYESVKNAEEDQAQPE